jgi:hypothetical protein
MIKHTVINDLNIIPINIILTDVTITTGVKTTDIFSTIINHILAYYIPNLSL